VKKYSVTGLPSFFIIDADENILANAEGYQPSIQFIAFLRTILRAAPSAAAPTTRVIH
jgi:thioredoxin-related protein